jgi:putative transcriptional regulator
MMGFTPLEVDRNKLTIMGVKFPNLERLERTIAPLMSIMYEGFDPTPRNIEILRDYMAGNITKSQLVEIYRKKTNAV